jgi:hypothetical protein
MAVKKFKGPIAGFDNPKTKGTVFHPSQPSSGQANAPQNTTALGTVFIRTVLPYGKDKQILTFVSLLGDTAPRITDGYGGWSVVARPRDVGLLEWTGVNPLLVEIPFIIDAFEWGEMPGVGQDTESLIRTLERMAGIDEDVLEPPLLWWYANAPHDGDEAGHLQWVIESLEWGDTARNSAGNRIRQAGTVSLRQWTGDEFLTRSPGTKGTKPKSAKSNKGGHPGTYKVKEGDTLRKIAKKTLHNGNRWPEILRLNKDKKLRGGSDHLKKGMVLRIP